MPGHTFHITHRLYWLAAAILLLQCAGVSGQQLRIPKDIDPAFSIAQPLFRQDTVTIRFFGDIMMHSLQIQTALQNDGSYDFDSYFTHMTKYLSDSDLNVGNMEFTLAGEPYTGYPSFSAPDSFGEHLADCGFNLFLCANNHIFDKGKAGLKRTLEIYRRLAMQHGIYFTGASGEDKELMETTPLIVNLRGIKVAFINATYGTNSPRGEGWPKTNLLNDRDLLETALMEAERRADISIALVHWGNEYVLKHSMEQESAAEWLAGHGADIIIGAHPHVIQDTGMIKYGDRTVPVAYSLGNCVSNMSAPDTQAGLMATLRIVRHTNGDISTIDPEYMYTWCSRPEGYGDSYHVIPLTDFIGKRNEWKGGWDYDKMLAAYKRLSKETGIIENYNR